MTTSDGERDRARQELIEIARGMLNGSIDSLEGCRSLVRLRVESGAPASSAFNAVRGVESEIDHYPLGECRAGYSAELLKRLDSEVSSYLDKVRPVLLNACQEIIREIETLPLQSAGSRLQ